MGKVLGKSPILSLHGRATLEERGADLYETSPVATQALLRAEKLPRRIWEPAAGRGAMVDVLRAAGHIVLASDLHDYGVPRQYAGRNFLRELPPVGCGAIVTNPPYSHATAFARHAIAICPLVCMLLRLNFLESTKRSDILECGKLARVHVFRNRLPMMHRDGWKGPRAGSAIAFAWYVWRWDHKGPTVLNRVSWKDSG